MQLIQAALFVFFAAAAGAWVVAADLYGAPHGLVQRTLKPFGDPFYPFPLGLARKAAIKVFE